jgi:hypothetical protein
MITFLLATTLVFPSISDLPNGVKVDDKQLFMVSSYVIEEPKVSQQKRYIDSLYNTQMQTLQSKITSNNQRFLNLINSKVIVGNTRLLNKNSLKSNVDTILDMSYRFNEASE